MKLILPNLRLNYGGPFNGGMSRFNEIDCTSHYQAIKNLGISGIRMSMSNSAFQSGIDASFNAAKKAKEMGLHVQWGIGFAGGTDATWPAFCTKVLGEAARAEAAGFDSFSVGNEENAVWKHANFSNREQKILDLMYDVSFVFSGEVTHNDAQDSPESATFAVGKEKNGKRFVPSYNVYGSNGSFTDWKNKINTYYSYFPDMQITEVNLNPNPARYPGDPLNTYREVRRRVEWLAENYPDMIVYWFTGSQDPSDNSGYGHTVIMPEGYFHPYINAFFEGRKNITRNFSRAAYYYDF